MVKEGEASKMENKSYNFYANAVNIATSIYDITIDLKSQSPQIDSMGKIIQMHDQPVMDVSEEIIVRMSPQHAKAFAALLVKNIIEYEKQFNGTIPLIPEIKELWEKNILGKQD